MKVRPDHTEQSNKQNQNNVQVGCNPGKSVFTMWPVFSSLCNCIFHVTGYKLIDLGCQKLIFSKFSGGNLPSQIQVFVFTGLVCTFQEELDLFSEKVVT